MYYSTDSQEHRINTGEERDPDVCEYALSIEECMEDILDFDLFLNAHESEDRTSIHDHLLAGEQ